MRKSFIYSYTRLQARHGMRPDEHIWQIVESKKELANYLQAARQTSLKNWLAGIQASDNHHAIETTLIKLYQDYILDIARWVPSAWRDAVRWVVVVPYLPAIQHLISGNSAQSWMLSHPDLKEFTATNLELRLDSFSQSPYAPLLAATQADQPVVEGWLAHWRALWPEKKPAQQQALNALINQVRQHREIFAQLSLNMTWRQRQQLTNKLTMLFRKYAYQPVAVFIHLLLVALDMERLRGAIMQRSLFPDYVEKSA
jgi:hypothetical protein